MAIDIGADAIDRLSSGVVTWTRIGKDNPANASGTITSVEIWAYTEISDCIVGTFYTTNGNTLKCRDSEAIGTVTAGSKQTFSGLSIAVEAGDYLGIYGTAGAIERHTSGYNGIWAIGGEYIDPGDEATFNWYAGDAISLYGTGTEAGGVIHYGAATLSGVGTLSAIGRGIFVGKATLTGTGLLSAMGRGIYAGKATLAGVGTLSGILRKLQDSLKRGWWSK